MSTPRRLHVVVAVWGATHVERWAAHSLRTQLSAGNLPALARRGVPIDYHLFTDDASAPLLRQRTSMLSNYAAVHLRTFSATSYLGNTFQAHMAGRDESAAKRVVDAGSVGWATDYATAEGGDPALCLLTNDLLLSGSALGHAWEMLARGTKGVMVPVLRLARELTGWPAEGLLHLQPDGPGLSSEALCALLPHALHSLSRRLDAASEHFTFYPTSVLWSAGDDGWLCRSFHPHPLMVIPVASRWLPRSTVDYAYAQAMHRGPDELRMPGPDDDIAVFKHTPSSVFDQSRSKPSRLNDAGMARFLYFCTNRAHVLLARQPVRLVARRLPGAEQRWREIEARTRAQLDGWTRYLQTHGTGFRLGDSDLGRLWHASHFGPIDAYLCPGRARELSSQRRDFGEFQVLMERTLMHGDALKAAQTLGLAHQVQPIH